MSGQLMPGVGTDLVEVSQMRSALTRRPGLRERLFTDAEWEYAHRHRDPMPHLAARFAAKEAVMKSLGRGIGAMGFNEIEVRNLDGGAPVVEVVGRAAAVAREAGVDRFQISLTHTPTMAHAVVLAVPTDIGSSSEHAASRDPAGSARSPSVGRSSDASSGPAKSNVSGGSTP